MLKLTPEEIRQFIQDSGLVKGEEEITSSKVVKVLMALADHAAQHAAEAILEFVRDWYSLSDDEFKMKYGQWPGLRLNVDLALPVWFKSQGVKT